MPKEVSLRDMPAKTLRTVTSLRRFALSTAKSHMIENCCLAQA